MATISSSFELAAAFQQLETCVELGAATMQPTPATVDTETTADGAAKPYELDDENFKTVAKGSLFLTHTDTIHAIPFHSAVQTDAGGGDKFRTCKFRRTAAVWTTHEFYQGRRLR